MCFFAPTKNQVIAVGSEVLILIVVDVLLCLADLKLQAPIIVS